MQTSALLEWQNLIFLLPMAFALILLGVSMLGGDGHHGEHDMHAHIGGGHELDGYGTNTEADDGSFLARILDVFGVGRVPVSILVFTWCMLFGFIGLVLQHYFLDVILPVRLVNVAVSGGVAFVGSGLLTSIMARIIGHFMPRLESYGERKQDFINREAEVRYTITANSGTVTLIDKYGNLQQLQVCLHESCKDSIPPHTRVILLSYNAAEDTYLAIPASQLSIASTSL